MRVNGHDSIENAWQSPVWGGFPPVSRPPDSRCSQEIESQHLEYHGKPDGGHTPDAKMLDPGQTIKGGEGPLDARTEPVPIAELRRLLPARRLAILTCFLS